MSQKFRDKYRNGTDRATWWDYSHPASYFITICTLNRIQHFGEINNGFMCLSQPGTIAWHCWEKITLHFPFVTLGEFVIMPDHVHGIINIIDIEVGEMDAEYRKYMSTISPKHGSLGSIIRSYKSAVSKEIHLMDPGFKWQSRFYGHIIRDQDSFDKISIYIHDNPLRWKGNGALDFLM